MSTPDGNPGHGSGGSTAGADGTAHGIVAAASVLHGVLDEVAESPAWSMSVPEQQQTLVELTRAAARLEELRLRVLAAADANKVGAQSAASSTGAWLAAETRLTARTANAAVNLANDLDRRYQATGAALAAGALHVEQARVIIACLQGLTEAIPAEEADRRLGEKLRREEEEAARNCYLKLRPAGDGSYTGRFKLPALHAELLQKALLGLTTPTRLGDSRLDADGNQFRRDHLHGIALMELIEHLPGHGFPHLRRNATQRLVTLDLDKLLTGLGTATLDTSGTISAARRLACEAGLIPLVLGGDSVILDQGREARYYDDHQEIALTVRDKHCTATGCDRPPSLCHKHHNKPWSQGGRTDLTNGRLLCPWHHARAHDPRYQMTTRPDNQVKFTRRT